MLFPSLPLIVLFSAAHASPLNNAQAAANAYQLTANVAVPFAPAAPLTPTNNQVSLLRRPGLTRSSAFLHRARQLSNVARYVLPPRPTIEQQMVSVLGGAEYVADVKMGDQLVTVIIDTGSSDTWLIANDFQCTDQFRRRVSQEECKFGEYYDGHFLTKFPNTWFNISYGDGEFVQGEVGTQDLTFAGVIIRNQTIAIGKDAYWNGDNICAGLLGLGYPGLTSVYQGTQTDVDDSHTHRVLYDPVFTSMWKQQLIRAPMFSVALLRNIGGYLAFGGVSSHVRAASSWASTQILKMVSARNGPGLNYYFYAIRPDAWVFYNPVVVGSPAAGKVVKPQQQQQQPVTLVNDVKYIVDSGTSLIYAPAHIAAAVNSQFEPPARPYSGFYTVDCNFTWAPSLGLAVGGLTFNISLADMVVRDAPTGLCITGVQDGGDGPYILGDTFMTNVISVFDIGAAEMRFAAHNY